MVDCAAVVPVCAWPVDGRGVNAGGGQWQSHGPSRWVRPCAAGRVQTGAMVVESTIWWVGLCGGGEARRGDNADAVAQVRRAGEDCPPPAALGGRLAGGAARLAAIADILREGRLRALRVDVDDVVHVSYLLPCRPSSRGGITFEESPDIKGQGGR